ncbi:uncharacterized protein G2W53_028489 [Senna tora]|uniref:Uncharacterized protein n=1 Tax=Senna tora TaxID=362788 RepID=A0A834W8T9_9FABA|nr:uncharacterized protein G2W53_028489 [Senna tora]
MGVYTVGTDPRFDPNSVESFVSNLSGPT